ncbi:MAG: M23 family metallopeptidase [Bacteroides sp.]|nr:M23 family metallopeptidase [Bacteroides sp.]MDE7461907.1 M23 family metallopeptidase [Muribaculaceae bacterium]
MDKKALYVYNPSTDNFERVYPTLKSKILKAGGIFCLSLILGTLMFLAVYFGLTNNTEQELRRENIMLRSQYNVLEGRLEASLKVMDKIRARDDNFYRVMMQMDPMSVSRRYAGYDYEKSYAGMKKLSDQALIGRLTQSADLLDHLLYSQSQSFDQLKAAAGKKQDQMNHIPGSLPIHDENMILAGGFGLRFDPISGARKFHPGIDFAVDEGTPVYATADGEVTVAERKGGNGNMIEIDHGYNYITRYTHLQSTTAAVGQNVKRGELIGYVGSTGASSGSHLHYEVRFKDEALNPINYFFLDLTPEMYTEMSQQADDAGNIMD